MEHPLLIQNIVPVAKIATLYGVPVVLSTVNVKAGVNQPTIPELRTALPGIEEFDRSTINAWEDVEFLAAVRATGRRKLIMAALRTEACLTFPALDAIRDGYEVYPVVDAVGGTSVEAHRAGLDRMEEGGAKPTSWIQLACELQRDWMRAETVPTFPEILFEPRPAAPA
jgi:nicotinamidase-related amidase